MSDGPDKTDELYPIAVLIDELKVPDLTGEYAPVHLLILHI